MRGTAVTRQALVGATEAEIATLTRHSLQSVRRFSTGIISRATRHSVKTRSASSKRDRNLPTDGPTVRGCSGPQIEKVQRQQMVGALGLEPRTR
jgi:hypothetical protein